MRRGGIFTTRAGFALDKGSCVGRIVQDLQAGGHSGLLPPHIATAISSRQAQIVGVAKLEHFVSGSHPQEGGKHEIKTILDLAMGILLDFANRIAHQADRQCQGYLSSLRLVASSGAHPRSDEM